MYPNADPWNWLVPDLVTALIRPPTNPPCRTSNGATRTWYSFTASIESGRAFTPPPGTWLLALSANRSLLLVPSIWMLLNRSFCPVIDVPPPGVFTIWGDVLTKSLNARLSVGSRRNAESEMNDWAPVRAVESSGSDEVSTMTPASSTAARLMLKSCVRRCPSWRVNGADVLGSKPRARTARGLGPPTPQFPQENRPSSRVPRPHT